MRNRGILVLSSALALFILFSLFFSSSNQPSNYRPTSPYPPTNQRSSANYGDSSSSSSSPGTPQAGFVPVHASETLLEGEGIMPHLGNETLKAELGRASWKLLHTMLARYPQKPTPDEREALRSYIHLFARLYPCGECGAHFRKLLESYPPQTSSRDSAAQWGCFVHNQVNARLKKPEFDCKAVTEHYKCGCADADEEREKKEKEGGVGAGGVSGKSGIVRAGATEGNPLGLTLEVEGLTKGG